MPTATTTKILKKLTIQDGHNNNNNTKNNATIRYGYPPAKLKKWICASKNLEDKIILDPKEFKLNDSEKKILRKVFEWPKIIETASFKYEPHRIPYYLYELATLFHAYWSKGNDDQNYKFIVNGKIKSVGTLIIILLVSIVIQRGMSILGVSLPEKM